MSARAKTRLAGWRRFGAFAALFGLLLESLINIGHAGVTGRVVPSADQDGSVVTYIEICTPTGIQRIAWDGGATDESPEPSSDPQSNRSPCLLCAALGALPPACPQGSIAIDWPPSSTTSFPPLAHDVAVPATPRRSQQSRAPPLSS